MNVDWLWALFGGLLIGCAGAVYLFGNGRIMGASGILGGLVDGSAKREWAERGAFIAGLVAAPMLLYPAFQQADTHINPSSVVLVAGGLLVGLGTRIANGCTSGHGVCGISRLSARGIAATVFYLLAGGVSVLVFRHFLGLV